MMTPSGNEGASHGSGKQAKLILFTSGDAPRSCRARANLAEALRRFGQDPDTTEEIDLARHPAQTDVYRIFATPALLRISDGASPEVLYGDLSERQTLENFLGLAPPRAPD